MKLSVMMITFNHEQFIAQAIESVLSQRVDFDYEIVIGDDCSTDGTRRIIMDFHRRYPNRIIPLLRDRNLGAIKNLTETLAVCRGQYVALLEGDDYWTHEDKLQVQVNFLDEHPDYAICCHRAQVISEREAGKCVILPTLSSGTYTIADLFDGNWIITASVMYRWDPGFLHDWIPTLKIGDWPLHILIGRTGKIQLIDKVMSAYRIHEGGVFSSLSYRDKLLAITEVLTALERHLGFQYKKQIRKGLARVCFELACQSRQDRNRGETGKHLLTCIRNGGWRIRSNHRTLAGLAAYTLIGPVYKVFSQFARSNPR